MRAIPTDPRLHAIVAAIAAAVLVSSAWPADEAERVGWDGLLAPLATGHPVHGEYRLGAPRRGDEHDIVVTARRSGTSPARVEVHVVDRGRWPDIPETASFGIAYEAPRSTAPIEDCVAVRDAIVRALAAHDRGALGPVDAIPLSTIAPRPWIVRASSSLTGGRGWLAATALLVIILILAVRPRGTLVAGLLLFVTGLALRALHLDLPFVRDQDVQRVLSGSLSLSEIVAGHGLMDRHPPLYFLVLHAVSWVSQGEVAMRAPAVLAGALIAPALVLAPGWIARSSLDWRERLPAIIAGAVAAFSPALVESSREVSEIPLFSLVLIAMITLTARAVHSPTRATLIGVAIMHALALHTYHLGLPAVVAELAVVVAIAGPRVRVLRWALGGVVAGVPALVHLALTAARDAPAREAARAMPGIAWGDWSVLTMLDAETSVAIDAIGIVLVLVAVIAPVFARGDRRLATLEAATAAIAIMATVALVAPFARAQPYYVLTAVPLALFAIASARMPFAHARTALAASALVGSGLLLAAVGPGLATLYTPSADAAMPRYAAIARERGAREIVTVAHYDALLMAWSAARDRGRVLTAATTAVDEQAITVAEIGMTIRYLARSHGDHDPGEQALTRLRALRARGPVLLVAREDFSLPQLERELGSCESLAEGGKTHLLLCPEAP